MASNQMFMSPRSDLTIRNLTAEQIEAISKAAVDIVGGVVSFSESAIYESEDTTKKEPNAVQKLQEALGSNRFGIHTYQDCGGRCPDHSRGF